jgi:hypothetical protein
MEMEAAHWVRTRGLNDIVIVIANGPPGDWLDVRAHLLPPSLRTRLTRQPVFVDLRPEVAALRADPHRPAVLGSILEALKQLILRLYPGSTWELLRGEERRQRRAALGWIGAVVIVLSAAAAISSVAAYVAVQQAAEARRQRENAEVRTAESTARALSIASAEALPKDPQRALLLALHAAAQTWNSHGVILVETQKALRAAAAATSAVLEVPLDNDLLNCTLSPDVSQVAAHTIGGRLVSVNLRSKARTDLGMRLPNAAAYPNALGRLRWSSDGQRVGYQSVASASVIDLTTRRVLRPNVSSSHDVEWDPTVRRLLTSPEGALRVWDSVREQWIFSQPKPARFLSWLWNESGSLLLTQKDARTDDGRSPHGAFSREVTLWDVDGNRELRTSLGPWPFWFDKKLVAGPSDGTRYDIAVFDITDPAFAAGARIGKVDMGPARYSEGAAFSPDSRFLAITGWEKVSVLDVQSGGEVFSIATDNFRGGNYHEGRWTNDGLRLGMLIGQIEQCSFVGVYAVGYLFSHTPKELVDAVRERVNGTLSSDDCERYLSTKVCPPLEFK